MAATTIDRMFESYGEPIKEEHPIKAGASLKVGALANFDSNGDLVDAGDTASENFAGIVDSIDSDAGTAIIAYGHCVELALHASVTGAAKGTPVCVLDNQTVATSATTTNDVVAGTFCAFKPGASNKGFVRLRG